VCMGFFESFLRLSRYARMVRVFVVDSGLPRSKEAVRTRSLMEFHSPRQRAQLDLLFGVMKTQIASRYGFRQLKSGFSSRSMGD
jgi:hypothetical protein